MDEVQFRFTDALPSCPHCGRASLMAVDLNQYGRGLVVLCQTCDSGRPARVAWLEYLAAGKAKRSPEEMGPAELEEAKRLWDACFSDLLSDSPLGMPMDFEN
ncbi:DUF6300 family protein [Streptosporangium sp. NPDC051022]|uniref:DUF6300 family protein n=1 Tax=Streptosporangium sp. NPDC051022 TaxID=3155752 RepID=UPI0034243EA2